MSEERHKEIVKKLEDKYLGKYLILKDGTTTDEIISVSVDYDINKQDMNRLSDSFKTVFVNEVLYTTDAIQNLLDEKELDKITKIKKLINKKKETILDLIYNFTKNANSSINYIVQHYGIRHQLKKFNEECYELMEAVTQYEDIRYTRLHSTKHITEEIADVLVLLMQIQTYYDIKTCDIKEVVINKIIRQLERIENVKNKR